MKKLILYLFLSFLVQTSYAQETTFPRDRTYASCNAQDLESNSEECLSLVKREQLKTVIVKPQIRTTRNKPNEAITNVELAPVVGGTGRVR